MKKRLISIVTMVAMLASMLSVGITVAADTASTPVAQTQNQNQGDGIILKKSATADPADGTVEIMIDAYTTGTVSSQATATPADIVLVLDVSGSMKNKYADVYTYNAVDGGSYISGWNFFIPIYGYGFSADNTTYYVDDGGTYRAVTRASEDANRFRYYSYTDANNNHVYVYPKLGSGVDTEGASREHAYPVVQFYKGANTSVSMMQALQTSVDNFIDRTFAMNNMITDEAQKHRIAVVKYADDSYYSSSGAISDINGALSSAIGNNRFRSGESYYNYTQLVHDFAVVDEAGDTSLKAAVDALETGGATAVDYGLKMAQATLNRRTPAEMAARKEVVIVFSDGEPTHGSEYSQSVAGEAINIALSLKNAGTVVYSLSVLAGANSTVLDGTTDTNKFMHYISNNYPEASYNESTETITAGTGGNPTAGYYMTPATEQNLTSMFEHIIQQIGTPNITLGEETAVVDTLSPYFDLNTGDKAADIKIETITKTIEAGGTVDYGIDDPPLSGIEATVSSDGQQIIVTGFDFDENYVSTVARNGNFGGKVLRIRIKVKPNYDAIDKMVTRTNIVPTNKAEDPAKVVSPNQAEPIATTASPSVGLNKVSYEVDGDSFANGYYDVFRLPGSEYKVIFEPTKEGHTFKGWKTDNLGVEGQVLAAESAFTMPANDVVIRGEFEANKYDISYKYVGTVPGGVVPADPSASDEANVPYGTPKTVEEAPDTPLGYTFSGWQADNVTPDDGGNFNMPAGNVEFAGSFKANGNTKFKIEHYLQNLDGTYPGTATESYEDQGTTDTLAAATPNQYEGFTFDADHTDNKLSGTIAGDGSLVLKLYYERNSYTVSYAYTGTVPGGAADISSYGDTYKFGEDVTVKDAVSVEGYEFHGWISEEVAAANGTTFKMPAKTVIFNGHFVASGDTVYKVEHYLQKLDGTYPSIADRTADHRGQTDTDVEAMPIYFEGFLFDADNTSNVKTGKIAGDGSLVLKLYYERELHDVDYEYIGIVPEGANELLPTGLTDIMYGTPVDVEPDPYLAGYRFEGWQSYGGAVQPNDENFAMPNRDVQLRGQFIPLVAEYTVKYIAQDENGGNDYTTVLETKTFEAYTGASVTAVRKDFTGYTFNASKTGEQNTGIVKGDNSLVLYLYYDRYPVYTVEYAFAGNVPAGVTVPTEPDHIEGEEVTLKAPAGTYEGYKFEGWTSYGKALQNAEPGTTFDMPARNVHLTGYFTPNPTGYTVEYYFENIRDDGYSIDDTKTKTVTKEEEKVFVGDSIVAAAEPFEGFKFNSSMSSWEGVAKANPADNVLRLYYDRLDYNVSYAYWGIKPDGAPDITDAEYPQKRYKYGDTVTIKPDLSWDADHQFLGWYSAQTGTQPEDTEFTMPAKDVVLVGSFISAISATTYTVKHYIETSYGSNDYIEHGSGETVEGAVVGEPVTATPKTISGYTYNPSHPENAASGLVLAGDALILKLFYTKNYSGGGGGGGGGVRQYILTFESNGGTKFSPEKHNSGKVVKLDEVPKKDGYIFDGWHLDETLNEDVNEVKMTKNITVYANWVEDNGTAGNGHETPDSLNGNDHFAYVIGYPDGTVRPNANITRAEVTSIFFRLLKESVREANLTETNVFNDVDDGMWYNTAISTMAKLGVVNGRYGDRFVSDEFITRAEFATICARFDNSEFTIDDNFTDVKGHWAENDIHEAAAHGWIRGYEDGSFRPDRFITRAEAMTMINRVLNRVPENKSDLLADMVKWPDNKETDWYYLAVQEATNSHDFDKKNNIYEKWTKLKEGTDWVKYQ